VALGTASSQEYTTNPRNSHVDGALAMARSSAPIPLALSSTSASVPSTGLILDTTVFGTTLEGLEVISALRQNDVINTITIEHVSA